MTIQNKTIPFKDNIQKAERQAIKTLQDRILNKEIVITKADTKAAE